MAGSLRIYRVAAATLIGASPVAMFLLIQELVQHVGLVVEGSYAIQANPSERYNDYWNKLSVPFTTHSAILERAR
jgi:hypothetical protein